MLITYRVWLLAPCNLKILQISNKPLVDSNICAIIKGACWPLSSLIGIWSDTLRQFGYIICALFFIDLRNPIISWNLRSLFVLYLIEDGFLPIPVKSCISVFVPLRSSPVTKFFFHHQYRLSLILIFLYSFIVLLLASCKMLIAHFPPTSSLIYLSQSIYIFVSELFFWGTNPFFHSPIS